MQGGQNEKFLDLSGAVFYDDIGFGGMFSGLLFPLIIFFIIYKSVTKNNNERQTIRRRSSSGQSRTRLSGRQSDLVNEALGRYFRSHEKTAAFGRKSACVREKAEYTGLRNLILLKEDDCIGKRWMNLENVTRGCINGSSAAVG